MPRLSISELTTYRWSFDEDLYHIRRAGYEAIGIWRRKLADFGFERGLELLDESGLGVSSVAWAGGFTGNDGRTTPESLADARAAIRLAGLVGAGCLVVHTGGRNNHTQRHAQRLVRNALDELTPLAEQNGVTLALKPMHPACAGEWTTLTCLEAAAELVACYATPRVKLVYDTYHFPLERIAEGLLADLTPMIGLVQLGDAKKPPTIDQERCPLGAGDSAVAEAISILLKAGYAGDFDVELMGAGVEAADYDHLLADSRAVFLDAVAAAGLAPSLPGTRL